MAITIDHGRVEFLGIEIIFIGEDDPRGSVWVPFNEELSLLYGKNGAGKSTILNAISAFVNGVSLEDKGILIHGYARVIDSSGSCSIMNQAVEDMKNTGFLDYWDELEAAEMNSKYAELSAALNLPFDHWEPSVLGGIPDSIDDLDMDWNKFVSHYLFLGLWEADLVHDHESIKDFVGLLIQERLLCLRPNGKDDQAEWQVTLASTVDESLVRESYEHLLVDPQIEPDEKDDVDQVAQLLLDVNILANRENMPRSNSPFISASRIAGLAISQFGLSLVDLNEEIDLEEWTTARVAELIYSDWITVTDPWFADHPHHPSPTKAFLPASAFVDEDDEDFKIEDEKRPLIWSATFASHQIPVGRTIEFELISEREETLQKALSFIARELPQELGISDLRIHLVNDLGLWMYNKAATLEALDQRSGLWIPVSNTSSTTRKIIGMALKIHADIRSRQQPTLAIGDEVDRGLHSLAINGLLKMLAESISICFVATHSSVALSSRLGKRRHIHRGAGGEILMSEIDGANLASTTAAELGVSVNELIGTVDLIVAVEGQHDLLILKHFMALDERFTSYRIHPISMSGLNNANSLVEADIVLSLTDLDILAIADNVSKTELSQMWSHAKNELTRGTPAETVARNIRQKAKSLAKEQWFEQRRMVDLLALAVEKGLHQRILLSGHPYADIEMALNHEYFNLPKDWLELEAEHKATRESRNEPALNFKDFVRKNYNISIDLKTIQTALDLTSGIPFGIQPILDDIISYADRFLRFSRF